MDGPLYYIVSVKEQEVAVEVAVEQRNKEDEVRK
jgi:hypothetical protein